MSTAPGRTSDLLLDGKHNEWEGCLPRQRNHRASRSIHRRVWLHPREGPERRGPCAHIGTRICGRSAHRRVHVARHVQAVYLRSPRICSLQFHGSGLSASKGNRHARNGAQHVTMVGPSQDFDTPRPKMKHFDANMFAAVGGQRLTADPRLLEMWICTP